MLFVVFSPLLMGVWKVFFGHVVFFCFVFFTSTASCGPSSSDHSSWGGPAHPFSHEPQHRHTVHRHGEVPLQRERERERMERVKGEECEECELTATFVNRQNSSLWNWGRIVMRLWRDELKLLNICRYLCVCGWPAPPQWEAPVPVAAWAHLAE